MSVPKIRLTDVAKRFGRNVVLDGVNLSMEPGESVAIIGGSGTGKSVTLKCILGLLTPERGSIKVDGEELLGVPSGERSGSPKAANVSACCSRAAPCSIRCRCGATSPLR